MDDESIKRLNPLECGVCSKEFNNPVHLPCLHVFCNGCLQRSDKDESGNETDTAALCCPECSAPLGEAPPTDLLAKYLVDTAHEPAEICANCDQIAQPMFFCETCQQALCVDCRQNTHQAKMFSTHRLISLEERARVKGRVSCAQHGEPYILFCVDEKRLVCIQCFNGRPLESRHSFVSIDTAHSANVEKLEKWANKLRLYQVEKKEEVDVRKRMLTEIDERSHKDHLAITQLCQDIIDTVTFVRDRTVDEMGLTRKDLETECGAQMAELSNVMAPIRLYLLSAQILCSSASKIDFLQFYADLVKRIQSVLSRSIGRPPLIQWKDLDTARADLSKALEPHIGMSAAWLPSRETREGSGSASYKGNNRSAPSHGFQGVLTKYQIMVDLAGAFGERFARIDLPMKDMANDLSDVSRQVQEAQRDLTRRKVLLKTEFIDKLIENCANVDSRLGMHSALIAELQPDLQELWQEALDRVRRQQIMYREKVEFCMRLRETARQLLTGVRQLAPFAKCLESMSATIDPKRCHPPDPAPMESICLQISTIEPDSERRIQAIEEEENNRRLNQEAKRREEVEQRSAVGKLHKAKGNKKKSGSRLVVNTNRERSPGGTDVTLMSPCLRERSPPPPIEERLEPISDQELEADEDLPSTSVLSMSPTHFETSDTHETGEIDQSTRSPSPTTIKTINQFLLGYTSPNTKLEAISPTLTESELSLASNDLEDLSDRPKLSDGLAMKGKSKRKDIGKEMPIPSAVSARSESLAARITIDVGNSRDTVLRSLQDVFSERDQEDAVVVEQPNVLASAVKSAERRFREKETQRQTSPKPMNRRKTVSIGETPAVKVKDDEPFMPRPNSTPMPLPPPMPPTGFPSSSPQEISSLKPFEAREKMLESLRERIPRIDATPEPEIN
ncbi:unnamed protein product, partial [Mesorhabditis belari]|uniref:RING finger protein 207 n=1 Tax=Mesorhabditis belari TaxID=2138241 RepID=A0AAF3F6N4_9BILA